MARRSDIILSFGSCCTANWSFGSCLEVVWKAFGSRLEVDVLQILFIHSKCSSVDVPFLMDPRSSYQTQILSHRIPENCSGRLLWKNALERCSGTMLWKSALEKCSGKMLWINEIDIVVNQ